VFLLCLADFVLGFRGVSVCCVWESLMFVCRSEVVLCACLFVVGFGGMECVLFVGEFGVCLWV